MSSTTAPMIPLAAQRPTQPQKPAPSRGSERPSAESTFGAALRAAANVALLALVQVSNPSAARMGAAPHAWAGRMPAAGLPPGMPGVGMPVPGMPVFGAPPPPTGVDARLWESLTRGAMVAGTPAGAAAPLTPDAITAMAGRVEHLEPAVQALTPATIREHGQAFLR